jgi:NADH:ubiquinone oxidoreductase subunit 5 (subunit L)/multisubunit Na+/H+ antiporter MnhA subunit
MLMLITADNFIQLFLGWEGVGLCSYLLINFWFTRLQANKAGIKAMIINRVGDVGLACGVCSIFTIFKTSDFSVVFSLVPYFLGSTYNFLGLEVESLSTIGLLLFIGSVGKSAQIGLHTWLPDAMEGPTPVSALIHAATMVTAGVYLIIRCSPLYENSGFALVVITIVGALTAFIAGTIGLVQNDLKKVIAYSTCSQLGYMVFAAGLSGDTVSMFHLSNDAFFNLANTLVAQDKLEESVKPFKDALAIDGSFKEAKENLEWVLKRLQQKEDQKKPQSGENQDQKSEKNAEEVAIQWRSLSQMQSSCRFSRLCSR